MINLKTVVGVVIVAILVGVLYVVFEKNFVSSKTINQSETSSAQELSKEEPLQQTSTINLPAPEPTPPPITESSDLLNEATILEMRDYSSYFEDLKGKTKE